MARQRASATPGAPALFEQRAQRFGGPGDALQRLKLQFDGRDLGAVAQRITRPCACSRWRRRRS